MQKQHNLTYSYCKELQHDKDSSKFKETMEQIKSLDNKFKKLKYSQDSPQIHLINFYYLSLNYCSHSLKIDIKDIIV